MKFKISKLFYICFNLLVISIVIVVKRHHSWLGLLDDCVLKEV